MSEAVEDGRAGWTLVQVSELVRRAEELLLDGVTLVGPHAHAGMAADAAIAIGCTELGRLKCALGECIELAEQLELLAARLPDRPVAAAWERVAAAAAADMADGIVDPRRALLAARLLDVARGWEALAVALTDADAVAAWERLSVEELLGRFRDADPQHVAQVVTEAGIEAGTPFAACSPDQLTALAVGLRRHSGQPTP